MKEIFIGRDGAGKRLDKFLMRYLSGAPKPLLYEQIRKENITRNGKRTEGGALLEAGDRIECYFSEETWRRFLHPAAGVEERDEGSPPGDGSMEACRACYRRHPEIRVLYADGDIVAVDKPAGLLSQRAVAEDESLNDWLLGYLEDRMGWDPASLAVFRPSVCHRLDRNTSGIVLCARSLAGAQGLSASLRERTLSKYYLALLHGRVEEAAVATAEHARSGGVTVLSRTRLGAGRDQDPSRARAVTAFAPLRYSPREDATLVAARLVTGKTHQLRAQFAALGHPIVGDGKYGGDRTRRDRERFGARWQMLHAAFLRFPRPFFAEGLAGGELWCPPSGAAWERWGELPDAAALKGVVRTHGEVFL